MLVIKKEKDDLNYYCQGCKYEPMCGKKPQFRQIQHQISQIAKNVENVMNVAVCLDRKLETDAGENCIKVFIGGKLAEKGDGESDSTEEVRADRETDADIDTTGEV